MNTTNSFASLISNLRPNAQKHSNGYTPVSIKKFVVATVGDDNVINIRPIAGVHRLGGQYVSCTKQLAYEGDVIFGMTVRIPDPLVKNTVKSRFAPQRPVIVKATDDVKVVIAVPQKNKMELGYLDRGDEAEVWDLLRKQHPQVYAWLDDSNLSGHLPVFRDDQSWNGFLCEGDNKVLENLEKAGLSYLDEFIEQRFNSLQCEWPLTQAITACCLVDNRPLSHALKNKSHVKTQEAFNTKPVAGFLVYESQLGFSIVVRKTFARKSTRHDSEIILSRVEVSTPDFLNMFPQEEGSVATDGPVVKQVVFSEVAGGSVSHHEDTILRFIPGDSWAWTPLSGHVPDKVDVQVGVDGTYKKVPAAEDFVPRDWSDLPAMVQAIADDRAAPLIDFSITVVHNPQA